MFDFPQNVKNAIGVLIQYTLASGKDVEQSVILSMTDIYADSGIQYGDWEVTVRRVKKPYV